MDDEAFEHLLAGKGDSDPFDFLGLKEETERPKVGVSEVEQPAILTKSEYPAAQASQEDKSAIVPKYQYPEPS